MAFKIHDLLIDVLPQSDGRTCHHNTDIPSECQEPSCADCRPHSHCPPPSKHRPEPEGVHAAGLLLLRRQLHEALSRQP
jgi:hypothetical protein